MEHPVYEFGAYRLNPGRRELSGADGKLVPLTPKAFDLLSYLVEHAGTLVSKATLMKALWPDVVVEDNALNQAVSTVRQVLGDKAQEPRYIATLPGRGYQFVAEVKAGNRSDAADEQRASRRTAAHKNIRFCTTPDGVRLAYALAGEGSPIVRTAHWLSHVEYDWDNPVRHHMLRDLSANHQLIRYDHRGNGLSDRDVPELSLDCFVTDLETVVDASGAQRFALVGMSMGVPISIAYAVRHPDRVSHLILYGGTASALHPDENAEALSHMIRGGWGQDNPAFRQLMTTLMMPNSTLEEQQALNELQRLSTSPENAARMVWAIHRMDVRPLLSRVSVPTLVVHARDDATVPLEAGRKIAASIAGARFVVLESRNHTLLEHDPAALRFKEELLSFIEGA